MLHEFTAAQENFQAILEEEPTSTETTVDLEIKVAEEVTEPMEEVEEAEDVVEETEETTEEMLAQYDMLDHYYAVTEEFGWSKALAKTIDPTGSLQAYAPTLPAMESLDEVGSPSSNETLIALEGFKEMMSKFWTWVKQTAAKIKETIMSFFRAVVNMFSSYENQGKRVMEVLKGAKISEEKLKEKKVSLPSKGTWNTLASDYVSAANSIRTQLAVLSGLSVGGETAKFEKAFSEGATLGSIGLKSDSSSGVSEVPGFMKKFDGKEASLSALGWTSASDFNLQTFLSIVKLLRSDLPAAAKGVEAGAKKVEADAARMEKAGDKEAKASKENAKKAIKSLNGASRICKQLNKIGAKLCKIWIKAAYAVYSCRGEAAEKGKKG